MDRGESQAALGVGHDLGRALLSRRAHEREQELIDELERLNDYRQEPMATVSDELKNPLGVILGHVEMLEAVEDMPKAAATSLEALGRGTPRSTRSSTTCCSQPDEPTGTARWRDCRSPGPLLAEVVADEALHASERGVHSGCATARALCVEGSPRSCVGCSRTWSATLSSTPETGARCACRWKAMRQRSFDLR